MLNLSYVIASSADFHQTVKKVVAGLNSAGFSSRDCRAQDADEPALPAPAAVPEQTSLDGQSEPDMPDVDGAALKARFDAAKQEANRSASEDAAQSDPMLAQALEQNRAYEREIDQADDTAYSRAPWRCGTR